MDLGLLYETVCEDFDRSMWSGGQPPPKDVGICGRHARLVASVIADLYGETLTAADLGRGQDMYEHGDRADPADVARVRAAVGPIVAVHRVEPTPQPIPIGLWAGIERARGPF